MPRSTQEIPPAVFLPPAFEQFPDLGDWLPNDKHLVAEFLAPDSPRALALAEAGLAR